MYAVLVSCAKELAILLIFLNNGETQSSDQGSAVGLSPTSPEKVEVERTAAFTIRFRAKCEPKVKKTETNWIQGAQNLICITTIRTVVKEMRNLTAKDSANFHLMFGREQLALGDVTSCPMLPDHSYTPATFSRKKESDTKKVAERDKESRTSNGRAVWVAWKGKGKGEGGWRRTMTDVGMRKTSIGRKVRRCRWILISGTRKCWRRQENGRRGLARNCLLQSTRRPFSTRESRDAIRSPHQLDCQSWTSSPDQLPFSQETREERRH
jgi:hypothetical protein